MNASTSSVIPSRRRPDAGSATLVLEDVPCGVCGHRAPRPLYAETYHLNGQSVRLVLNRCSHCRQHYVSPRLDPSSTQLVYTQDHQQTISHNYCWDGVSGEERFRPLIERLRHLVPTGSLLDVGCGAGQFLQAAGRHHGWTLTGLEPHPNAAQRARKQTDAVIVQDFLHDGLFSPGSFAVVSLLGVLEHVHDPVGTLQSVHRLLQPEGVVAIYVPNFYYLRLKDTGLVAYLRSGHWSRLFPQEHLFQYTPATLRQLLARAGFELLRLDVGQPFMPAGGWRRWAKRTAYAATCALWQTTGWHFGGIEAIARRGE